MTFERALFAIALVVLAIAIDPIPGLIILACVFGAGAAFRWLWRRVS